MQLLELALRTRVHIKHYWNREKDMKSHGLCAAKSEYLDICESSFNG